MRSRHILLVIFGGIMCCLPHCSPVSRDARSTSPMHRAGCATDKIYKGKQGIASSDIAAVRLPAKRVTEIKIKQDGDASGRRRQMRITRLRGVGGQREEEEEVEIMRENIQPDTVQDVDDEPPPNRAAVSSPLLDEKFLRAKASESIFVGGNQVTAEDQAENGTQSSSSSDDHSSGPLDGEPFFDGVQHCRPILATNTGEINRVFDELTQHFEEMQSQWESQIGPKLEKIEKELGKEYPECDVRLALSCRHTSMLLGKFSCLNVFLIPLGSNVAPMSRDNQCVLIMVGRLRSALQRRLSG